jgi:hypothetical protein
VRVEALEVPFDLVCSGSGAAELAAAIESAWEWCLRDSAYAGSETDPDRDPDRDPDHVAQRLTVLLEQDAAELAAAATSSAVSGADLQGVMDLLTPTVTTLAITERRAELVMFHACAVADPATGDTVVLYGPSGTGKTTMARTLCTELVYLSDETAGVARDLRIVPYPKPLSIIAGSDPGLKDQVSPGRLRLVRPDAREYRLRGLVQLCREPAHPGDASLELLPTVDALPELVAQTSYTRELGRPLHHLAELAHRVGGVRRATYAEAEQLRPLVRAILDGDA